MYIILAILLLAILIVVHEFGHFMAARAMKIDVREFAVGFGPKLVGWKSKKYETTFAIRAIPMGGYCSFYGEDDATGKSKDDPRNFGNHSVWKRMFVILMGPMMNFVLAFVAAVVLIWCTGITVAVEPEQVDPFIQEVMASGPAHDAGMKAGDEVLEINGKNMMDGTMDTLLNTISGWKEEEGPLRMTIRMERRSRENADRRIHRRISADGNETRGVLRRYRGSVENVHQRRRGDPSGTEEPGDQRRRPGGYGRAGGYRVHDFHPGRGPGETGRGRRGD